MTKWALADIPSLHGETAESLTGAAWRVAEPARAIAGQ
jgi:hypothetical protein